ncbi:MAG: hypothetical protein JXR77_18390 [Lentisphaeria bacterium]|nr:hypothetical protein [Lentisphaeria bacterium]
MIAAYRLDTGEIGTESLTRIAELLRRRLLRLCGVEPRGEAPFVLRLAVGTGEGEGYSIADLPPSGVAVTGDSARGLLYGVGRFLRGCRFGQGAFEPSAWRGTSAPAMSLRAMYFATHFHNWYHDAPVEEIVRYVEDLGLWGCNTIAVWFDMHHYSGLDDPAARRMIGRLRTILEAAAGLGLDTCLMGLANEAFRDSPSDLRADWTAGHDGYTKPPGGHYHVELCPSRPGALDLLLRWRGEVLQAFRDLGPRYTVIWPYDQGGCTCAACTPWGANGFLRAAEAVAGLTREILPQSRIVLSTWYFNHFIPGEWEALCRRFAAGAPEWIDYLLVDDYDGFPELPFSRGVPGGLPVVGFPEISMAGNSPWGGFGALVRPRHWEQYWHTVRGLLQGSFPYSEGRHDDISKVLLLQWQWDPDRAAGEILTEYAETHLTPAVAGDAGRLAYLLEEDLGLHAVVRPEDGQPVYRHRNPGRAEEAYELARSIDGRLPAHVALGWRWRLLWLRAAIGAEIRSGGGASTALLERCFEELVCLYSAEEAERPVAPPSRRQMARLRQSVAAAAG